MALLRFDKSRYQNKDPRGDTFQATLPADRPDEATGKNVNLRINLINQLNDERNSSHRIFNDCGLEGSWQGRRVLGKGGFGMASVYEMVNDQGEVDDRVVVKEQVINHDDKWEDSEIPEEVVTMIQLNKVQCENIVRIRDYKRFEADEKDRLYLEFCDHGTLSDLRANYKNWGSYFPERFLWHVFEGLVRGVRAMARKRLKDNACFRNGKWEKRAGLEIIHLDLKPENIYLARHDIGDQGKRQASKRNISRHDQSDYPTVKIGDFGLATFTLGTDPRNPGQLYGRGTYRCMPPEQNTTARNALYSTNRSIKYNYKSHVWCIGMLIWELIHLLEWQGTHNMRLRKDGHGIRSIEQPPGKITPYSEELLDLVRNCLRPDPDERPGIEMLERSIVTGLSKDYGHEDDEVYYKDNEINDKPLGEMVPTWDYALDRTLPSETLYGHAPGIDGLRTPTWVWNKDRQQPDIEGRIVNMRSSPLQNHWPVDVTVERLRSIYVFGEDNMPRPLRLRIDHEWPDEPQRASEPTLKDTFDNLFRGKGYFRRNRRWNLESAWVAACGSIRFQFGGIVVSPATLKGLWLTPDPHRYLPDHRDGRIVSFFIDAVAATVFCWAKKHDPELLPNVRLYVVNESDFSVEEGPLLDPGREFQRLWILRNEEPLDDSQPAFESESETESSTSGSEKSAGTPRPEEPQARVQFSALRGMASSTTSSEYNSMDSEDGESNSNGEDGDPADLEDGSEEESEPSQLATVDNPDDQYLDTSQYPSGQYPSGQLIF